MSTNTALLVIDAQGEMFAPENPVYEGPQMLERIRTLIERARAAGTPVVYVQHTEPEGYSLAVGQPAWEIPAAIAPFPGEPVVRKATPDSFHETDLRAVLESRGIDSLILVGMQTEMCVDTTCRRAFSLGYKTLLVSDAHSTWDNAHLTAPQIIAHHNYTLAGCFAACKKAEEIVFPPADGGK